MRRSSAPGLLVTAAALSLGVAPAALAAKPVAVSCGQVITRDTTLANDLRNCHTIGLVVGADDVTLDLNGHTVDGDGRADFEGINVKRHDRVRIRHGTVTDFVEGVAVLLSKGTRVTDLAIARERHVGVFVSDSRNIAVDRTASSQIAFAGLYATRSHNVRLRRNSVTASGAGIATRLSDHLTIAGNSLSQNGGPGINLSDDTTKSAVNHNGLVDNEDGIVLDNGPTRNVVAANSVSGSGAGVVLIAADANRVDRNTLTGGTFAGVVVVGSDRNRVERNSIAGSGHDPDAEAGIHLVSNDDGSTSDRNLIARNDLMGDAPDGLLVDRDQRRNR
ncbi:MAG: right-handed parallel beta-helix repeat-containing protein, partial [Thermoleophilaceae bacterium]